MNLQKAIAALPLSYIQMAKHTLQCLPTALTYHFQKYAHVQLPHLQPLWAYQKMIWIVLRSINFCSTNDGRFGRPF